MRPAGEAKYAGQLHVYVLQFTCAQVRAGLPSKTNQNREAQTSFRCEVVSFGKHERCDVGLVSAPAVAKKPNEPIFRHCQSARCITDLSQLNGRRGIANHFTPPMNPSKRGAVLFHLSHNFSDAFSLIASTVISRRLLLIVRWKTLALRERERNTRHCRDDWALNATLTYQRRHFSNCSRCQGEINQVLIIGNSHADAFCQQHFTTKSHAGLHSSCSPCRFARCSPRNLATRYLVFFLDIIRKRDI